MSAPVLVTALGTIFAVDPGGRPDPFIDTIAAVWSDARVIGGTPTTTIVADAAGDDEAARRRLQQELTRAAVSHVPGGVWVLRAAAVADSDGAVTLLLAGRGDLEGFTEAAFRSRGFVSAGYVGIDATGAVLPFREPRPGHGPEAWDVADAASRELPATLRVTRILVPRTADATAAGDSHALDPDRAAEALVASSVNLRSIPAPLRRVADVIEGCVLECVGTARSSSWTESQTPVAGRIAAAWLRPSARRAASERPGAFSPRHDERCFHGPVLDSDVLDDGRRVILRDVGAAVELRVLDAAETAVWQRADGVQRTAMGDAGETVDEMTAEGLLGAEPAWRIGDAVAWVDSGVRITAICSSSLGAPALALEGSARVIWSVLAEERVVTQSGLLSRCASLFDVEVDQLSDPVESLLIDLQTRGMVVRV